MSRRVCPRPRRIGDRLLGDRDRRLGGVRDRRLPAERDLLLGGVRERRLSGDRRPIVNDHYSTANVVVRELSCAVSSPSFLNPIYNHDRVAV